MTHPEDHVTVLGAARDVGPIVRLGYGTLRRTTAGRSRVMVADNGCDDDAVTFLSAQPWLELIPLGDRLAAAVRDYELSTAALESLWSALAERAAQLTAGEQRILDGLRQRVKAQRPPEGEDFVQLGETVDWLLPRVTTRYAALVDSDVEFRHPGWLTDIVETMDERDIDLFGFREPVMPPVRERFATYVLAMRTETITALDCSFATRLEFEDDAEARRWYAVPHNRFLDVTAFADYPSARFYDTAARVYEAATRRGLRCEEFPAEWRGRFRHLGHMAWSGRVDDSYAEVESLRDHRAEALEYAEKRCTAIGIA